jgi:hypothetical protein
MASYDRHGVEDLEPGANDRVVKQDEKNDLGPSPEYEDPFGDEELAEVKYRTMAWW